MRKIVILSLFLLIFLPKISSAQIEFNPGRIIEDYQLLDFNSMSLEEIQNFLEEKNSYLANLKVLETYGK